MEFSGKSLINIRQEIKIPIYQDLLFMEIITK